LGSGGQESEPGWCGAVHSVSGFAFGVCRLSPHLYRLFEAQPTYQQFFSFRDVPDLAKLREDKRLKAHVRNVMHTLAMVVDNLDEPEVAQEMLDKIARSHIQRQINEHHFEQLKGCLVSLLTDTLGKEVMNEQALTAWSKTYDLFTQTMINQLKTSKVH